ncbi:MAG: FmdE family protein [Candidatus Jordarchaeales archaeon]|nr:hypothetical protein [Candidatus Jordarchaeia archaeon]
MDAEELLGFAVKFHGHLGPFLVLGLRAGLIARKLIGVPSSVEVRVFPRPPLSCVIDGVQVSSGCTVGNGKLLVKSTRDRLKVKLVFRSEEGVVDISLLRGLIESLLSKMPASEEEMEKDAMNLLGEDEQRLFIIKRGESKKFLLRR